MNVVINIFQGYMASCMVTEKDTYAMRYLSQLEFIADDKSLNVIANKDFIEFNSSNADITCYLPNYPTKLDEDSNEFYVVCSFKGWRLEAGKVMVFTDYVQAHDYYNALRKLSRQYEDIIKTDSDTDNFLDDNEYAVFIEQASCIKD